MMKITNKHFYEEHQTHYEVITDTIRDNYLYVTLDEIAGNQVEVDFNDCYLDESGDLFVPIAYKTTYKGSNDFDDPDTIEPVYDRTPTMTKLEIENLVAQVESPELNDPARHI